MIEFFPPGFVLCTSKIFLSNHSEFNICMYLVLCLFVGMLIISSFFYCYVNVTLDSEWKWGRVVSALSVVTLGSGWFLHFLMFSLMLNAFSKDHALSIISFNVDQMDTGFCEKITPKLKDVNIGEMTWPLIGIAIENPY